MELSFFVELQSDLTLMEDACGNLLQGSYDPTSASLPLDLERPAEKVHRASAVLIELLTPPRETRKLSGDSEDLLLELVQSVTQLDLTSHKFFPLTPTTPGEDPCAFIKSASTTLNLTRKVLHELRGSTPPVAAKSKKAESSIAASIPFILPLAKMGIADDDLTVRKTLSTRILPDYKMGDIPMAIDGITAVDDLLKIHGSELDVLFLDNSMPGRTGEAIIHLIRSHPEWSKIVVIFLTTDDSFNEIIDHINPDGSVIKMPKWKDLGFDAYLIKPTSKKKVEECLTEIYKRLSLFFDPAEKRRWITNNRACTAAAAEKV